jgi:ATP-dependent DNA helicase RecQ
LSHPRLKEAKDLLNLYFGYPEFRDGQIEIIESVLNFRDTLGIMPTGGGKSLCYQIPALMNPGTTLIISPLIALMKDQIDVLQGLNIPATFINSSISPSEADTRLKHLLNGKYKLLYIAPERLSVSAFIKALAKIEISLIAIDEAHCVSQWGHDFRPSYLKISQMIEKIGRPPIIALTATATKEVRQDIVKQLNMEDPQILISGFDRKNLKYFTAFLNEKDKKQETLRILSSVKGSAIIYASTKKVVVELYELLIQNKFKAVYYHGGMNKDERTQAQNDWLSGKVDIVAATNAFGMGIDKANVRTVIHYNMPASVEAYYQEAGRAGRDGYTAYCLLFYNTRDDIVQEYLIEMNFPPEETLKIIYHFLFQQNREIILLTYKEIADALDINEMQVSSAIKLFERYGIVQRLQKSEFSFRIRFFENKDSVLKIVHKAPMQKKVVEYSWNKQLGGIQIKDALRDLQISKDQLLSAINALKNRNLIEYTPPFRGRGIKITSHKVEWENININFAEYDRQLKIQTDRLDEIKNYMQHKQCKRRFLLTYFGEKVTDNNCNGCSICLNWMPQTSSDSDDMPKSGFISGKMETILSCVLYYNHQYGITTIVKILTGENEKRLEKKGIYGSPYYGKLKESDSSKLYRTIHMAIKKGYMEKSEGQYPVLSISGKGLVQLKK